MGDTILNVVLPRLYPESGVGPETPVVLWALACSIFSVSGASSQTNPESSVFTLQGQKQQTRHKVWIFLGT